MMMMRFDLGAVWSLLIELVSRDTGMPLALLRPETVLVTLGYDDHRSIRLGRRLADRLLGDQNLDFESRPQSRLRRAGLGSRTLEDLARQIFDLLENCTLVPRITVVARADRLSAAPEEEQWGSVAGAGHGAARSPPHPDRSALVTRILFATDRAEARNSRLGWGYGSASADGLHYGECEVSVPLKRKVGQLPLPRWWRLELQPSEERHFVLRALERMPQEGFYKRARDRLLESDAPEIFIFVHGFRTSFANAALRTAQLSLDLQLRGLPILYSWPSRGGGHDYLSDGTSVERSATHFTNFLAAIANGTDAQRINILAHSMGGRALAAALQNLGRGGASAEGLRLDHAIFAAPDIDAAHFQNLAPHMTRASRRLTVYASEEDRALKVSKLGNRGDRTGGSLVVGPWLDSIDACAIQADMFRHSYFAEGRAVLADLVGLLAGHPPEQRPFLDRLEDPAGPYFRLRRTPRPA